MLKALKENKVLRIVLIGLGALLLLLALWKVFFSAEPLKTTQTEEETRLTKLLVQTEGVDKATVYITSDDEKPCSAVVVFEGTDSILTRMRILDITVSALNIEKKNVQVYPAG